MNRWKCLSTCPKKPERKVKQCTKELYIPAKTRCSVVDVGSWVVPKVVCGVLWGAVVIEIGSYFAAERYNRC